jgi:hypothetical protein
MTDFTPDELDGITPRERLRLLRTENTRLKERLALAERRAGVTAEIHDEEQARLRAECERLREALALAIEAADAYVPPLRDLEAEWGQRYIPPYVRAEHEAHPAAVARRKLEQARAALAGVGEES